MKAMVFPVVLYGCKSWTIKKAEHWKIDAFELRCSVLGVLWKDWCWSWNSNTLATWYEEQTHLKRPWCWERLGAGAEGNDRGWDGWMSPPTRWTWVWVNSEIWWWTGRPGVLRFVGSQRVGHDWATKPNWMEFRKMVTMTLYARQQKRHRCKEQTFGLCGRRWGWDDLRE